MNKVSNVAAANEYAFFVRDTKGRFDQSTGIESSFNTWEQNKANMKICKVVSVTDRMLKGFIRTFKSVYEYAECVQVPEDSENSISDINRMIDENFESEKTDYQKQAELIEKQNEEIELLKEKMNTIQRAKKVENEELKEIAIEKRKNYIKKI